ncbi:two-component system response regulator TorR [Zooshikella marina]|uniref:Two-component system response regulator TorR n=1 Tax=Zooshikella ganghwensis TaxID=202772 RepID=A0A4P9VJ31_9GAMM|nr:two-component system response regulator TorR [Zooshikella ganghwensis]MBU2704560.1 two-component system response regulator TorR [Zooshikella ganghwensis]RDH43255.1 two-component system response regulator TorR [Zooshikella ganghwensis]
MQQYHVLVVEDEPVTRAKLVDYFLQEGYRISEAADGNEMRSILQNEKIDLIMLDINLPGEDGLLLTRDIRSTSDVGIILVTGRTDRVDRIVGLEMGADDYVTKPFELRELRVRVKNLLWRISKVDQVKQQLRQEFSEEKQADRVVLFGPWTFDIPRRMLSKGDSPVKLTKAEYEVLLAFVTNPNSVLGRDQLLSLISHRVEQPNDRTIDVLVRRLRSKIEDNPRNPRYFVTIHGEGYLFAGDIEQ